MIELSGSVSIGQEFFDLALVRAYVSSIRKAGQAKLESLLASSERHHLSGQHSLSIYSWAYYEHAKFAQDKQSVIEILNRDSQRCGFVVGSDITISEDLTSPQEFENQYRRAIDLVGRLWPEVIELRNIINPIISKFPQKSEFESSSDPKRFGQIYFNMNRSSPVGWAEILVHELAHHYLFVVSSHSQKQGFRREWETILYSSIRKSNRPLIGLFHGIFAQAAMLLFAHLALTADTQMDDDVINGAKEINTRFTEGYLLDMETITNFDVLEINPTVRKLCLAAKEIAEKSKFSNLKTKVV